jgi:hypothetical protein
MFVIDITLSFFKVKGEMKTLRETALHYLTYDS